MNVTLPNGQVINGVPDGTSKDDIMQKAISSGMATAQDFGQQAASQQPESYAEPLDQYKKLLLRRSHGEQGLDDQIGGLFTELSEQRKQRKPREIPQPTAETLAEHGPVMFGDMITGADRMTKEMEDLPHLGSAPELNEMTAASWKSNLATFTTGDEKEIQKIFKSQYGDKVSFRKDEKNNVIVDFPSGSYPLNKPGISPQDVPKFMSDLLAFNPAARAATIPGAIAKSAIAETALEGADVALGGDFSVKDVGISAALGGGIKALEDVISTAYRSMVGKNKPEADELLKAAEEAGIPVLTTDALPPKNIVSKLAHQTGEKIPIAGTGGVRASQQEAREKAVSEVAEKYGEFSYKSIVDSLRESKNKVKKAAGNVLGATGDKLDVVGNMTIRNTKNAIADAQQEFSKPGIIQSKGAMADLDTLIKAIDDAPQTFTTLKENRTAFREIIKGADKAERSQLTSRAKTILENVEKSMTDDMKSFAKDNLTTPEFNKWVRANKVYGEEATKMTKTKIKNILDHGDATPESVERMLFSKKPSELKNLYSSLGTEGKQNARAAIISKIINTISKRKGGVTPDSFATELGKHKAEVSAFFKGSERKQLEGLERALNATRRAQESAAATPTGQGLIGGGMIAASFQDLGATLAIGGTLGSMARIYESKAVRAALLKLAGSPKGSTAFDRALEQVSFEIRFASQAVKDAEDKKQ